MAHDITALDASKFSIAEELYIATADDNYVVARWSFIEGFDLDFLWLAVHALVSVLNLLESLESVVFQGRRSDSKGDRSCGRMRTDRNTIVIT